MSPSKKDVSVNTPADALRIAYGPHAAKKIAREFNVALNTAKCWLAGRFPEARREELVQRIIAELDRQDIERDAIRRQIREARGRSTGEKSFAVGSGNTGCNSNEDIRLFRSDRAPVRRVGAMT